MKVKDGFVLRAVGDDHMVVPVGAATVDFNCIITLNESGAFLWQQLQQECDMQALISALLSEYTVSEEIAAQDVAAFVDELKKADLLV